MSENSLILIRNEMFGMMYFKDEMICYTIDPHVLIKGTYKLVVNYSPKFKTELPLLYNDKFPASRGIRCHSGNTLKDSQGCLLVGNSITYTFTLIESKKALERLLRTIKENNIKELIII